MNLKDVGNQRITQATRLKNSHTNNMQAQKVYKKLFCINESQSSIIIVLSLCTITYRINLINLEGE